MMILCFFYCDSSQRITTPKDVNREDCTKSAACAIARMSKENNISWNAFENKLDSVSAISLDNMDHSKNFNDPLPTTNKFCCYFNLKPALTCYVFIEFIVWIIFLLSSLNLQLEALEYTDLLELETALRKDLFYLLIFGPVEPIPHQNARCKFLINETKEKLFQCHISF